MKATGIVRRIDDLGRVVVPKEIRKTMRIHVGEPMEIFTGKDGEIVLKKYSPIEELGELAREYVQAMAQVTGCLVGVTDQDQVVAAGGPKQQEYQGRLISPELEQVIRERKLVQLSEGGKERIPVIGEEKDRSGSLLICPIITEGDAIGSVFLIHQKKPATLNEADRRIAQVAAGFLGKQMEG